MICRVIGIGIAYKIAEGEKSHYVNVLSNGYNIDFNSLNDKSNIQLK